MLGIGKVKACMWCTGALYATNIGAFHPLGIEGWRFAFLSVGLLSASIGDFPHFCCRLDGLSLTAISSSDRSLAALSCWVQSLEGLHRALGVCAAMQGS